MFIIGRREKQFPTCMGFKIHAERRDGIVLKHQTARRRDRAAMQTSPKRRRYPPNISQTTSSLTVVEEWEHEREHVPTKINRLLRVCGCDGRNHHMARVGVGKVLFMCWFISIVGIFLPFFLQTLAATLICPSILHRRCSYSLFWNHNPPR